MDPNVTGPLPNLPHCEVVRWLNAMLDVIPYLRIRYSLSFWILVLAEVLWAGKANIFRIDLCPCEDELQALPGWKGPDIADLPPSGWLVSSRNNAISGAQLWSLSLADWTLRGSSS